MITIEVHVDGLDAVMQMLGRAPEIAKQELLTAMNKSLVIVQGAARANAPVGVSGDLRRSINMDIRNASVASITGVVGTSVVYGPCVEMGTVPHYPPLAPLRLWVQRKLQVADNEIEGVARAIQRKIGRAGTLPKPFLMPAWEVSQAKVNTLFNNAVKRIVERMSGK